MRPTILTSKSMRAVWSVAPILIVVALNYCARAAEGPWQTSADARAAAKEARAQIVQHDSCEQEKAAAIAKLNETTRLVAIERGQIEYDKRKALEEFRAGFFCSQCNRSRSEIESQDHVTFERHLIDVQGHAVPANSGQIGGKAAAFDSKIQQLSKRISGFEQEYKQLAIGAIQCHVCAERARVTLHRAELAANILEVAEKEGRPSLISRSSQPLQPGRFGLNGNIMTSEYDAVRAYLRDGTVRTLAEDSDAEVAGDLDFQSIRDIRTHHGVDYSSRDAAGVASPLLFSAGVEGTASVLETSPYNTVEVEMPNGNRLQFLHASEIRVKSGEHVTASTVLGKTGSVGAASIHLHVQARDSAGNFMDPSLAILPDGDPWLQLCRRADQLSAGESEPMPVLKWSDSPGGGESAPPSEPNSPTKPDWLRGGQ